MDENVRRIVLDVEKGDKIEEMIACVVFCESSASLTVNGFTMHIPWTELATWLVWLATKMEES